MINRRLITEFKNLTAEQQEDHLTILNAIALEAGPQAKKAPGKKRGPKPGFKRAKKAAETSEEPSED